MPRIMPEPRYFSIPSTVVGAVALRKEARNWTPCARSLVQDPLAWTNSPAEIIAAWPTTVMRSRWPRALTRSTQKPFSELWNVTPIDQPSQDFGRRACSWCFRHQVMMENTALGRYRDQATDGTWRSRPYQLYLGGQ